MNAQRYWLTADTAYRAVPCGKLGFVVEYFDRKAMMWQSTNINAKSVAECRREVEFIFSAIVPDNDVQIRVIYPD